MEFVGRQHPSYSRNRGPNSQAGVDSDLLAAHPEQVALRLYLCVLGTRPALGCRTKQPPLGLACHPPFSAAPTL